MPKPNRFAAVDTSTLLALEAGDEICQEAIDSLSNAGFYFIVTETPMQELGDMCQSGEDEEIRAHAKNALIQITNFGFILSSLGAVQMGVADQVARKIIEDWIPEAELNCGLVMAEAAYNNCRFLISRQKALLDSERISILFSLAEADLFPVLVSSPEDIVAYFNRIKE